MTRRAFQRADRDRPGAACGFVGSLPWRAHDLPLPRFDRLGIYRQYNRVDSGANSREIEQDVIRRHGRVPRELPHPQECLFLGLRGSAVIVTFRETGPRHSIECTMSNGRECSIASPTC